VTHSVHSGNRFAERTAIEDVTGTYIDGLRGPVAVRKAGNLVTSKLKAVDHCATDETSRPGHQDPHVHQAYSTFIRVRNSSFATIGIREEAI
jgi:hypothetical protein